MGVRGGLAWVGDVLSGLVSILSSSPSLCVCVTVCRKQAKANRRKVFPTAVSWGIVLGYVTAAPVSPLTSLWWRPMGATLARSAAIGQQAIAISGLAARRGGRAAGRCAGAHGNLGIECVGRLGLNSLLAEASARCR